MTVSLNELRALFPTHFSRRGTANSSVDGRFWATLILENVRVVGPFWSIVIKVDALSNGGSDAQVLAERVASESAPTQSGMDVEYHPATALFLRPTGIWNDPNTAFRTPNSFGNSRISAVAAATVEANDDSALELPFVTASGDSQDSGLLPDQPEVLLQPLGRLPLQVASDPRRALTAMRLETGWIGTRARASYMANLRRALGLLEPGSDGQDLYFMPDGVGFKADVVVPWQQETISAWFRLGFHGEDATRGALRIWRKSGADDQDAGLAKAVDRLVARLTFERGTGPQWLSLNTTQDISAERLFWPTHSEAGSILQSRNTAPECWLDGEAVELRLSAEGVSSDADQMTVHLPALAISGTPEDLTLSATETLPAPPDGALASTEAQYTYRAPPEPEPESAEPAPAIEEISLGTDPEQSLDLVLPGLATAQDLGNALGIYGDETPPLLWVYTPIDQGWLHWPLPYPTTENVYQLVQNAPAPIRQTGSLTSGRLQMSQGAHTATPQRDWRVSLSRAGGIDLSVNLTENVVRSVDLALKEVTAAVDGAVPVTIHRQSPERMIPDNVARALRTRGLTAVTPNQLSDLEARLVDKGLATEISLRGVTIRASSGAGATMIEQTPGTITVRLPDQGWDGPEGRFEPWAWLRHGALPFVQAVTLSETGSAEETPSTNRELAPFVLPRAEHEALEINFGNLAGMSIAAPALALQDLDAKRPTQGIGWKDEAGMVATTLSSAIIVPGLVDDTAHPLRDNFWAGLRTPCHVTMRHDIPNTDGLWTQAKLPPPLSKETKDSDPAPPLGFVPQADNGPGNASDTKNAWRGVWTALNRGLALSALDRREMVTRTRQADDPDEIAAPNILGDLRLPVEDLTFSERIALDLGAFEPALDHVAGISFSLADGTPGGRQSVQMRGLPDVTSLEGLSGTFRRGDGSTASVRLGTVRAGPGTGALASAGVLDQLGLISNGVHYDAGERTLTRTLERYLPGDPDPTTWNLVTTLHGNLRSGALTLALVDIPFKHGESVADLGSFWRSKDGTWPESFIDASGMDLNHIAGFSWGVEDSDRNTQDLPDGVVLHENWVLAPRALYYAETDDPNEFQAAKIWCQAFVRSWSEAGVTFLPTSGQVSVGFGRARRLGDFQNVRFPIADTAQVGGVVPTLVIDTDTGTRLEYTFGGESLEISGYLDDRGSPKVFETDPKTDHEDGFCILSQIIAPFDPAEAPEDAPNVDAIFKGKTSLDVGTRNDSLSFDLSFTVDLLSNAVSSGTMSFSLFGASHTCTLRPSSLYDGTRATFDFEITQGSGTVFGLPILSFSGSLFAGSSYAGLDGEHATFQLEAKALIAVLELGDVDAPIRFEINTLDEPNAAILSGALSCTGIHAWPELSVADQMATWSPDTTRTPTDATARFDSTLVPLGSNITSPLRARARVSHFLPGGVVLNADQIVTLYSFDALTATVSALAEGTSSVALKVTPRATAPAHIHSSLDTVLPAGIGPTTLAALEQALHDHPNQIGAIDLSGHHVVDQDGALIGLPMFAVLGVEVADPLAEPATEQTFDVPALSHLSVPETTRSVGANEDTGRRAATEDTPGRHTFAPSAALAAGEAGSTTAEHLLRVEVSAKVAMLAKIAQDPGGLSAWSLDPSITVRHGDVPENYTGPDAPWDLPSASYTSEVYTGLWQLMAHELPRQLLGSPDVSVAPDVTHLSQTWSLRVYVLSQDAQRVDLIGTTTVGAPVGTTRLLLGDKQQEWADWGQTVMRRRAPEAEYGVLLAHQIGAGRAVLRETLSINGQLGRSRPDAALSRGVRVSVPQGQYRPGLGVEDQALRTNFGYEPHGITAFAATTDTPHQDGLGQTANRLTETGTNRALRLSGQNQRILSDGSWVVSRGSTAFRRSNDPGGSAQTLRPALPPKSQAALAGPFVAGTRGLPTAPEKADSETALFVPPYIEEATIGGRPGAWESVRHSIETIDQNRYTREPKLISSAQTPVWLKSAAPIELGTNDRTRASSYEGAHLAIDPQPTAVVHGPAAPSSGAKVGLDRAPRSTFASTLKLEAPQAGILPRDWDGTFTLVARQIGTDADPFAQADIADADSPVWTLTSATLEGGGLKFRWVQSEEPDILDGAPFTLTTFLGGDVSNPVDTPDQNPAEQLLNLPPATPVQLTLLLSSAGVTRLVVFELLTAGDGASTPLKPLFFRFDDPAYNDQLSGLAKLNRKDGPLPDSEIILAADNQDLRPSDFVTVAIGHRRPGKADDPALPKPVALSLVRRRPGTPGVEPLEFPPKVAGDQWQPTLEMEAPDTDPATASVAFQLSDVRLKSDPQNTKPLVPGDRLEATATFAGGGTIRLRFDVVERPNLPENPTFYGVHRLDFDMSEDPNPTLSVPLAGFGVPPTHVELVDPTELLRGAVRRRAMNHWRLFEPLLERDRRFYALQKRTRKGASWLPSALSTDWQEPFVDTPTPEELDAPDAVIPE